ncbi:hypothetical protein PFISCL1PPCAC_8927, partial [Pristionchus fissidentatus]
QLVGLGSGDFREDTISEQFVVGLLLGHDRSLPSQGYCTPTVLWRLVVTHIRLLYRRRSSIIDLGGALEDGKRCLVGSGSRAIDDHRVVTVSGGQEYGKICWVRDGTGC